MSELPKGWERVQLSSLGKIVTGKTPPKKESQAFDGEIPFIKPGDIQSKGAILSSSETISEFGKTFVPTIPADSIVVTCIGNLGRAGLTTKESATNQQINSVIPNGSVNPKYLYYYILTMRSWLEQQSSATTVAIVNKKKFSSMPVVLAPLEEQKRIADKLDSVLAKVKAAQARLDKIPAILKRFRQSVLTAATSGDLTKDWRLANEKNEDWDTFFLKDISSNIRSGSGKKPTDECDGVPMLRSSAVRVLEVDYDDFRTISETLLSARDYISNDDLLFTRLSGSKEYVGNCSRVSGISNKIAFPDRLFKVELKNKKLAPFLEIYCSSPNYFKYIEASIKSSAGHQRITTEVIKNIAVRLPTEVEQNLIVSKVSELFERAIVIQKQYDDAKIRLDKLSQAILAKAFKGELLISPVESQITEIENSIEALHA